MKYIDRTGRWWRRYLRKALLNNLLEINEEFLLRIYSIRCQIKTVPLISYNKDKFIQRSDIKKFLKGRGDIFWRFCRDLDLTICKLAENKESLDFINYVLERIYFGTKNTNFIIDLISKIFLSDENFAVIIGENGKRSILIADSAEDLQQAILGMQVSMMQSILGKNLKEK